MSLKKGNPDFAEFLNDTTKSEASQKTSIAEALTTIECDDLTKELFSMFCVKMCTFFL